MKQDKCETYNYTQSKQLPARVNNFSKVKLYGWNKFVETSYVQVLALLGFKLALRGVLNIPTPQFKLSNIFLNSIIPSKLLRTSQNF